MLRGIGKNPWMRFLTIVRHCEATSGTDDYARTLTATGRTQAEWLRQSALSSEGLGQFGPTTCLVSAAARTRETYALAFAGTPFVRSLQPSELIYNGHRHVTGLDLLAPLAEIDPVTESLSVIAHNPSVLELVHELSDVVPDEFIDNFPVGAAYVLEIPTDRTIGRGRYRVVATLCPPS